MQTKQSSKLFHTWFFPLSFIFLIWVIKLIEEVFHFEFFQFGIYPRSIKGLVGLLTAPLIHANFSHLFSNTIPLLVLGAGLFYHYRKVAYKVFLAVYLMSGCWVWVAARSSFHIGASGIIYGLAAFLFVSGIIRKHPQLMSFSLFVVFVYGSLIWGILPIQPDVSWESHSLGMLAGIVCAIYYRKTGTQKIVFDWEQELDDTSNAETLYWVMDEGMEVSDNDPITATKVVYHYRSTEHKSDDLNE